MKRRVFLILLLLCCTVLATNVHAVSSAQTVQCDAVVSADSSCAVTLAVTVTYETDEASPVFPIPKSAESVTLNGYPATMYVAAKSRMVSLEDVTGGKAGIYDLTISYRLPSVVVATEEEGMQLDMQLLSGFPFPIDSFQATVTLPGPVEADPELLSGYYQQDIGSLLAVSHSGEQITIRSLKALKDNETLAIRLSVDGKLFPKTERTARVLGIMDLMIAVAMVLAVLYYFLTMRPVLPKVSSYAAAPDGVTAGETGLWYVGAGVDLTMLVVTWAQLGYVRIQVEEGGRVLLHKRMDMGNERSAYENRCYQELFGRRRIVDGTSFRYGLLCRQMARQTPRLKDVYRRNSGNPYLYRGLCALSALLSGIAMAGALAPYSVPLQVLLSVLLTVLAFVIQTGGRYLPLRHRLSVGLGLVAGAVWLALGIWSGEWINALVQLLFQTLAGVGLAFGGQRTELGQQALTQIRGMRKHMRTVSKQELQRLLKANPNYFYEMAPYALALGVDRRFARRFGRLRMPDCTYLIKGNNGQMTAAEWAAMLRATVAKLDERSKRVFWEKLTGR